MFQRYQVEELVKRMKEPRKFIQVVLGPRQVGKTTLLKQALAKTDVPYHFFAADLVPATQTGWISDCWESVRTMMRAKGQSECLLVIDEIQKIRQWGEVVKKEWDADTFQDVNIKVVLLGSSRVLLEKGLSDSMMGRFETIRLSHWTFPEMQEAFGFSLEEYLYFGGYPGAASLIHDPERWQQYIGSAIVDATIHKDILQDAPVGKPALLRQTFELGCAYSGKIVALTKMMGALSDAGNATTLSGYLDLLSDGGLLSGLRKFAADTLRRRASAPKFQVHNSALRSYYSEWTLPETIARPEEWGRCLESAIGAHLAAGAFLTGYEVYYWREGPLEVDFVLKRKDRVLALEVKGNREASTAGLSEFRKRFHPDGALLIGPSGIPVDEFLRIPPRDLFSTVS